MHSACQQQPGLVEALCQWASSADSGEWRSPASPRWILAWQM